MKLMELNWQKSRYMKTITYDECTRSEVRVSTVQTDHFALPKPWNMTFVLQAYHRMLLIILIPEPLNLSPVKEAKPEGEDRGGCRSLGSVPAG